MYILVYFIIFRDCDHSIYKYSSKPTVRIRLPNPKYKDKLGNSACCQLTEGVTKESGYSAVKTVPEPWTL